MSSTPRRSRNRAWVNLPNTITLLRLALVIPIAVLIIQDSRPVLTVVLLIGFGTSDWIDGYLARRLGQTTSVGAALDPIADRVGVGVIAGALVLAGHLPPGIILLIAAVDATLALAYLVARRPQAPQVSWIGKARTAVLMTGLAVTGLALLPDLGALNRVGTLLCSVGAGLHLVAGLGYLREMARQPAKRPGTSETAA